MLTLRAGYTVCGHLDGDGQRPARELAQLVGAVVDGEAEPDRWLTVRRREQLSGLGSFRQLGQRLFGSIVSLFTRQQFTDTTSGMRALNRRALCAMLTAALLRPSTPKIPS